MICPPERVSCFSPRGARGAPLQPELCCLLNSSRAQFDNGKTLNKFAKLHFHFQVLSELSNKLLSLHPVAATSRQAWQRPSSQARAASLRLWGLSLAVREGQQGFLRQGPLCLLDAVHAPRNWAELARLLSQTCLHTDKCISFHSLEGASKACAALRTRSFVSPWIRLK